MQQIPETENYLQMPGNTLYTAVVSFADFADLQQQVDQLQRLTPKTLRLARFTDMPHSSGGVNYWRSLPPPTAMFKRNIVGQSLARLCFFSEGSQATSLVSHAFDYFFDLELRDYEEIFLSFCIDCAYELSRTVEAGELSMRPYVTLPAEPVRSRAQAYVPEVCRAAEEFETDMNFTFQYIDGEYKDLKISSGAALAAALSQSPAIRATSRPFIDWEKYRENFRPVFHKMIQGADKIAFEFIFTGPIEGLSNRMAMFETRLGDIFTKAFVVHGFDHAYDPLLGSLEFDYRAATCPEQLVSPMTPSCVGTLSCRCN